MDIWKDRNKETPAQWAHGRFNNGDGRYKVRLADGREIFTWWQEGQWSVERLKPNLKVVSWLMPVIIA